MKEFIGPLLIYGASYILYNLGGYAAFNFYAFMVNEEQGKYQDWPDWFWTPGGLINLIPFVNLFFYGFFLIGTFWFIGYTIAEIIAICRWLY